MLRNVLVGAFAFLTLFSAGSTAAYAKFPRKPIKLIVYTKPGGAIDVFARKFQVIAKKYTSTTFVVVNKPGAGGIIAMKHVLKSRKDGHTIAAVTKSNIGKIVSSRSNLKVEKFNWLAMLVSDPEAVIVRKASAIQSWAQILSDAKANNGKQLWVGPATGGNDHVMALKTWNKAGISAKWIPYAGGGKAMAALMGGHGAVYVGNPGDVIGKPDLAVAAIASPNRLGGEFSNVPTFKELGVKGLDNEIMWRGFMSAKGIPAEAVKFYQELFSKISQDPDWIKYIESRGANATYLGQDKFSEIVNQDKTEFTTILKKLGVIR